MGSKQFEIQRNANEKTKNGVNEAIAANKILSRKYRM